MKVNTNMWNKGGGVKHGKLKNRIAKRAYSLGAKTLKPAWQLSLDSFYSLYSIYTYTVFTPRPEMTIPSLFSTVLQYYSPLEDLLY